MDEREQTIAEGEARLEALEAALQDVSALAENFGETLSASLRRAAVAGRDLDDVLRSVALRLSGMALDRALQPLDRLAGSLVSGLVGGVASPTTGKSVQQAAVGAGSAASVLRRS